ncbi:hypothetical protein PanWU01x14_344640 [Parasponia andersonii]|uniref:Uncharacterized protein n=1 Tax=Parasponia andersonii TaxID=3476 RepID=A0A2P5ACZ3_PARAD|nr:hypothetical protein PanWU01x14_344640 [Parasponia andersonii]
MSLRLGPSQCYGPVTLPQGNARGTLTGTHLWPAPNGLGLTWFFVVSGHLHTASGKGWSRKGYREDFTGHSLVLGFQGHLLLKMVYVVERVSFSLEWPEGQGREVPQSGFHLDPVSEGRPVDPSHSLFCQIVGGLAVMGPESLTQLCHHLLLPVGRRTYWASMVSSTRCPLGLEGSRLALPCPLHPRSGWDGGFSSRLTSEFLLDFFVKIFPPLGRQASDPASALDPVVLLGSSLRRRDVCSWLSFLRVPSDIVWLFIRGERGRESPTLFLTLNLLPTDGAKLLEQFLTSRPRVSEPLILYSPIVHVSSLSQNILNSKQGWKGRSGYLQRLSDA